MPVRGAQKSAGDGKSENCLLFLKTQDLCVVFNEDLFHELISS